MEIPQDVIAKKKGKKFWIKLIRSIHKRIIRKQFVNDGTEEPPERNDITEIFNDRTCTRCGNKLNGKQIKYCLRCKGEKS